ncbi:MAG: MBOAT family protein [Acetobacteraceae bacterium]|nr:MBOAT family protein [Acetobacteraceae bacterium]
MLFHSHAFVLAFLPICLGGFFLAGRVGGTVWALRWLVAASLVFYGWWDARFVPLLIGSILINHMLAKRIRVLRRAGSAQAARRLLTGGIVLNLSALGWFKYADFLLELAAPDQAPLGIALPLAISFFTFQQIVSLADSYHAPDRETDLLHCAAFITFFPHLIAGPLVRPGDIVPQLQAQGLATARAENLSAGLVIFLLGLGKKLVLADMFGGFADTGFDAAARGETLTLFEAWYATLAYALQIYFDFSGYSDMAIGLARMMNVRFPLNFNSPYQARNIADFWRSWHITLGLFLRDYVYIPLGGSRVGPGWRIFNLLATMLLCGLWHGAAWQFVVWGGLHGVFLTVHAAFRRSGRHLPERLAQALTLLVVILAWVPFRAANLETAWAMLWAMAGANGAALPAMIVAFFPPLAWIVTQVPVLPFLGDARTLSFPEVTACLGLGWFIVLALPNIHAMSERGRSWALTTGFAFTAQALFFAPRVAPFLYFRF